jgi:phosphoenolpyruvate phosphomutase
MTTVRLRDFLHTPGKLVKLVGAHVALGARLAESTGFDGVWASSFEIATANGVADGGVLPTSCHLATVASMAKAVAAPVVADCETGPGRVEEIRELVQQYEAAGAQGMCMEDAGVSRCSLLPGRHSLAPLQEFAGKIKTASEARGSRDFLVLARVQALVAGHSQEEALRRARAYTACGADVIVIHSRSPSPEEVMAFITAWDQEVPLAIIPTTYHGVTDEQIRRTGKVKMVIYANYGLRASITAVTRVFRQILAENTAHQAEGWVAGLDEVFGLQHPFGSSAQAGEKGLTL